MSDDAPTVTVERRGHLLLIGLNRPAKRNAFTVQMLTELADAYAAMEDDPDVRCGVVFAHGDHFTAGLDLADVAPRLSEDGLAFGDGLDPWGMTGRERTTPVVVAVAGLCLTAGIELMLAADVRVAAEDAVFGQIEVARGIFPFGGATIRFPREAGWGNAMRWLLTGGRFDAAEALRIGLVQEVVPVGAHVDAAVAIAETIAAQAPLGVRETMRSARRSVLEGEPAAAAALYPALQEVMASEDAREGLMSFLERREARFTGR
jgi:enoyl-CoA hydratase/carnithine racemase